MIALVALIEMRSIPADFTIFSTGAIGSSMIWSSIKVVGGVRKWIGFSTHMLRL